MLTNSKKYGVIILAAGFSSRMGELKAMLPFGGIPALSKLIRTTKLAGITEIVVVLGYNSETLLPLIDCEMDSEKLQPLLDYEKQTENVKLQIEKETVRSVFNPNYEQGMFTSVQAGVSVLNPEIEAFFVLPVDCPLIPPQVFLDLVNAYEDNPSFMIVPCFNGKKGHPPLLPVSLIPEILNNNGEKGLKEIMTIHQEKLIRLDLDFEEVVMDMDSKEDYKALTLHWEKMQTPDCDNCLRLLEQFNTPTFAKAHCIAVADLAVKIAEALSKHGIKLNSDLIRSSALLHDMVRDRPRHGEEGAAIARLYGFDLAADLIENHMFYLKGKGDEAITEMDILCLADKMMKETQLVDLNERAQPMMEKFSEDAKIIERIQVRFKKAFELESQINQITGRTIKEIWQSV